MAKITAKQIGGDDGYCWAILVDGKPVVEGLTRSEVPYYRKRITDLVQKEKLDKLVHSHKSTHHNNLAHIECPLCQKESPDLFKRNLRKGDKK